MQFARAFTTATDPLRKSADDPEQSKRFSDMAHEVEAEGSKEDFEKAFKKVAKEKPKGEPKKG
jgi:hypothetical protein